mmetsp:Transcript_19078/g.36733  ORF Transcript_19078/g.36733 Transcript_19078/m.36733 type:complete len:293 (-) Transcript_19078:134-1012(-)
MSAWMILTFEYSAMTVVSGGCRGFLSAHLREGRRRRLGTMGCSGLLLDASSSPSSLIRSITSLSCWFCLAFCVGVRLRDDRRVGAGAGGFAPLLLLLLVPPPPRVVTSVTERFLLIASCFFFALFLFFFGMHVIMILGILLRGSFFFSSPSFCSFCAAAAAAAASASPDRVFLATHPTPSSLSWEDATLPEAAAEALLLLLFLRLASLGTMPPGLMACGLFRPFFDGFGQAGVLGGYICFVSPRPSSRPRMGVKAFAMRTWFLARLDPTRLEWRPPRLLDGTPCLWGCGGRL